MKKGIITDSLFQLQFQIKHFNQWIKMWNLDNLCLELVITVHLGITYPYEVLESEDILLKRVT